MSSIPDICEGRPSPGSFDESGWHLTRNWTVVAASEVDALRKLGTTLGIDRGAVFKNAQGQVPDNSILLQRFTRVEGRPPAIRGGTGLYYIEAEYASVQAPLLPVPGGPAVWTVRATLDSQPVDHDVDGYPIVTSSEEPVDPPLTRLRPNEVLHGEFYAKAASSIAAYIPLRPFNGTLNLATFLGAPRGCVLCHPFQCEPSDTGWVKISVDFQYRPQLTIFGKTYEGWADPVIDRGRREIIDASATDPGKRYRPIPMNDAAGNSVPVDEPVFLDGHGKPLLPVGTVLLKNAKPPQVVAVNHYLYMDFNKIPGMRIS